MPRGKRASRWSCPGRGNPPAVEALAVGPAWRTPHSPATEAQLKLALLRSAASTMKIPTALRSWAPRRGPSGQRPERAGPGAEARSPCSPMEAELVEAVAMLLPEEPDELPADMAEAVATLHLLDGEAPWRAARTSRAPRRRPTWRTSIASRDQAGRRNRTPPRGSGHHAVPRLWFPWGRRGRLGFR
jgi:hypothetical protein